MYKKYSGDFLLCTISNTQPSEIYLQSRTLAFFVAQARRFFLAYFFYWKNAHYLNSVTFDF